MKRPIVYVDTDVVISSLISSSGAAFHLFILKETNFYISDLSQNEIEQVVTRLKLDKIKLASLLNSLKKVKTADFPVKTSKNYEQYVIDLDDMHIIAGAQMAKSKFLITYNLKHYLVDKIKTELGIVVLTPAKFLQYLRSLKKL